MSPFNNNNNKKKYDLKQTIYFFNRFTFPRKQNVR